MGPRAAQRARAADSAQRYGRPRTHHTPNLLITPLGCPSAHSPPQPTRSDNPPEPPKGAKTPHHASHQAQARHCTRLPSPQSNTSKSTPQKSSQPHPCACMKPHSEDKLRKRAASSTSTSANSTTKTGIPNASSGMSIGIHNASSGTPNFTSTASESPRRQT